jgi:signal transduction histidine kinase
MSTTAKLSAPIYRRLYPRISARITLPFLLTVLLIASVGVFIVTRLVAGSIQERLNNQLKDSAAAATGALVEIETQQLATLRLMAFTEGVAEALVAGDTDMLNQLLRPVAANAGVDNLIVFDQAGQSLYQIRRLILADGIHYDSYQTPVNVVDWPGASQVVAGVSDPMGDKFLDIVSQGDERYLYITAPVPDSTGSRAIGGISLGINAPNLTFRISSQALSEVTLLLYDGSVLGTTFRGVTADQVAITPAAITDIARTLQANQTPIEEALFNEAAYQVLYTPLRIRSEPLGLLAVALPADFVTERIGVSRNTFTVLFSLLFLGVAGLGIVVTRSIINPIRRMVETTRAIRTGDLTQRVELHTPDELGELGTSFDHMTDQLVRRNEEINQLYVAQLEETARRDAVLSSISDPVIVLDTRGRILLTNPTTEQLVADLQAHPDDAVLFDRLCHDAARLQEPQTVTLVERYFQVLARPVHMPSGQRLGYVVVFHDITTLIEFERVKDEMILQLSHELRTPLTAARGYVELIKMTAMPQLNTQGQEFVNNTITHMGTLERMVNQVIDVSAMVSDNFVIDVEPFPLGPLIQLVIDSMQDQIEKRELKLFVRVLPSVQQKIDGDRARLRQVLEHILRNAINYTLPGGWVEVRGHIEEGRAIIAIADSGVGIGPDDIDRVFERMYRGQSADAGPTDNRGLGLGLYISEQIIHAHRGTIALESELGLGTTVTIDLPTRQEQTR